MSFNFMAAVTICSDLGAPKVKSVTLSIVSLSVCHSEVATRLEKVSFNSNPKERQCQRILKLPHNCTHLTR